MKRIPLEIICEHVLIEVGTQLAKIDSPHSGYVAEAVLRLMEEDTLMALATLVGKDPSSEYASSLQFGILLKVAARVGIEVELVDLNVGAKNIFTMINLETLRRKGHVDYVWSSDIFENSGPRWSAL